MQKKRQVRGSGILGGLPPALGEEAELGAYTGLPS